jgi:hypothetical protein
MTQALIIERVFVKSASIGCVMVKYTSTDKVESIPFGDDKLDMVESCIGQVCYITLDSCGAIQSLIPVTILKCSISQI